MACKCYGLGHPGNSIQVIDVTVRNITCAGANGAIIITEAFSGLSVIGDFTIEWIGPGGFTANTLDILLLTTPGTYTLTITCNGDGVVCYVGSFDLIDDSLVVIGDVNHSCNGKDNGSIDLTLTGGIAPFTFAWTGPGGFTATTEDVTGLEPGAYQVTITDSGIVPCVLVQDYNIVELGALTIQALLNHPSECACDGTIRIYVFRGGEPLAAGTYEVEWSTGVTDVNEISGLCAGKYRVLVTDEFGCRKVANYELIATATGYVAYNTEMLVDESGCPDCYRCKLNITDLDNRIMLFMDATLMIQKTLVKAAYDAVAFGNVGDADGLHDKINNFNYLLYYLTRIYYQRTLDAAAAPDNKDGGDTYYYDKFQLGCLRNYFRCAGYDISALLAIFDLDVRTGTCSYVIESDVIDQDISVNNPSSFVFFEVCQAAASGDETECQYSIDGTGIPYPVTCPHVQFGSTHYQTNGPVNDIGEMLTWLNANTPFTWVNLAGFLTMTGFTTQVMSNLRFSTNNVFATIGPGFTYPSYLSFVNLEGNYVFPNILIRNPQDLVDALNTVQPGVYSLSGSNILETCHTINIWSLGFTAGGGIPPQFLPDYIDAIISYKKNGVVTPLNYFGSFWPDDFNILMNSFGFITEAPTRWRKTNTTDKWEWVLLRSGNTSFTVFFREYGCLVAAPSQ